MKNCSCSLKNLFLHKITPSKTQMLKSQVGNCIKKCLCLTFENWNMTLCEAGYCSNTAHKKKGKSFFFFYLKKN